MPIGSDTNDPGGETGRRPNVLTISPGRPFLESLARAVLSGNLPNPGGKAPTSLELGAMTILLPTRRAARALQEAFLDAASARALILPRIQPIAEGDEELSLLASYAGATALAPGDADIPPAASEIERRIVLTGLVQKWSGAMRRQAAEVAEDDARALAIAAGATTAAQAAGLAAELAALVDEAETEEADLSGLDKLVPEKFSEHWQKTLQFLRIALEWWPQHLAERKLLSPADRRNRLVRSEARRLVSLPPSAPVIVAGVMGSIPVTIELMRVVASLPNGAVVLPGFDRTLDTASWQAISQPRQFEADIEPNAQKVAAPRIAHPEHPQYALKRLIERLGVERAEVQELPGELSTPRVDARNVLISEAMRPASTTGLWHAFIADADRDAIRAGLEGVSMIEAPTVEDEAEVIALMLREVVETPGRTAALVSRDRLLARRVAIRLEAWGIRVDDSAGRPLAKTMPGAFLDLVVEAAATNYSPAAVVALLKHPLTRLGRPANVVRRTARALEIAAFRTLYLGRGLAGVAAALEAARVECAAGDRRGRAVSRLREEDWEAAAGLVADLAGAAAPLDAVLSAHGRIDLRDLVGAHVEAAEAVARLPEGDTARGLWAEAAGEAASLFITGLIDRNLPSLLLPPREYPDLYRSLVARETVRPKVPLHPRLSIWGPMEARLQQPDLVIIGALNDKTWPETVEPGPWLNRPMRQDLGLPSPEERIGYAAHDFTMLMGAPNVVMTRALKVDGVPAVASRWLLRLRALLEALDLTGLLEADKPWLAWAAWRNVAPERRIAAPEPKPPLELRPRRMSVSGVETWMANPYAIFARDILKLDPLPLIGAEPDAALRGAIVHGALSDFAKAYPAALPPDAAAELVRFARARLERLTGNPRVAAFWLMRIERFAAWFGENEPGLRRDLLGLLVEADGKTVIEGPAGPFTLTARADRIDVHAGGAIITDYKSGANLSGLRRDAENGFAPQLALEAVIALEKGFANLQASSIAGLRYISVSGGDPPGGVVDLKAEDFAALALAARQGLAKLIALYDDEATPYSAVRRARFSYDYDDYAHLARVAEWSGEASSRGDG
jgi:ATP-dependent helicase/nuclease subunit B